MTMPAIEPEGPDPPLPRIDLAAVRRARSDLYNLVCLPMLDYRLANLRFSSFAEGVADVLGDRCDRDVVARSCEPLLGQDLTDDRAREFCWRLAGNLHGLRAGLPALPWTFQRSPEWMPLQVTSAVMAARPVRAGDGRGKVVRQGCTYGLQVLAGSACPATLSRWWSREQYSYISGRLGFTRGRGKRPFRHAKQLAGLRLYGLFTPDACQPGRPGFRKVAAAPAMVDYNHRVVARRFRIEPCPFGYEHECHRCAIGYRGRDGADACKAAFHATTYLAAPCPGCGRPEAPFDTDVSAKLCIECIERELTSTKE